MNENEKILKIENIKLRKAILWADGQLNHINYYTQFYRSVSDLIDSKECSAQGFKKSLKKYRHRLQRGLGSRAIAIKKEEKNEAKIS